MPRVSGRHRAVLTVTKKAPGVAGGFLCGGPEGTRTPDPLHAMQVRYQLRHRPICFPGPAGATRKEYNTKPREHQSADDPRARRLEGPLAPGRSRVNPLGGGRLPL